MPPKETHEEITWRMGVEMRIESTRLLLRPIVTDDAPSLLELFSDPIAMQHFPGTKDLAGTREWIKEVQRRYARDGYCFLLVTRKADNAVLGYCGLLLQKDVAGADEVEVGYGLKRIYWRQGYATEAAAACLKYGFNALGLKRIISLIRPENTASIAVALRNGLRFERNVLRWDYLHGIYAVANPAEN